MSLKNAKAKAKQRIKILKNMEGQLKNEVYGIVPVTFVEELAKMLQDTTAFRETIAKAALGQSADYQIPSADYSEKGMKKTQEKQKEQLAYLEKIQNLSLKNAIQKLEIDDKSALVDYLIAIQEGRIAHPAVNQYFQQHRADILYLCCLDPNLNQSILGHYQMDGIQRSALGEKNWNQLPYVVQQSFVGDPQLMPCISRSPMRS